MAIKTDGDIVRLARQHQRLMWQISSIINEIEESEHPNGVQIANDLKDQCEFLAWPEHVVHSALEHPEQWETGDFGIRHKAATQAKKSRKSQVPIT